MRSVGALFTGALMTTVFCGLLPAQVTAASSAAHPDSAGSLSLEIAQVEPVSEQLADVGALVTDLLAAMISETGIFDVQPAGMVEGAEEAVGSGAAYRLRSILAESAEGYELTGSISEMASGLVTFGFSISLEPTTFPQSVELLVASIADRSVFLAYGLNEQSVRLLLEGGRVDDAYHVLQQLPDPPHELTEEVRAAVSRDYARRAISAACEERTDFALMALLFAPAGGPEQKQSEAILALASSNEETACATVGDDQPRSLCERRDEARSLARAAARSLRAGGVDEARELAVRALRVDPTNVDAAATMVEIERRAEAGRLKRERADARRRVALLPVVTPRVYMGGAAAVVAVGDLMQSVGGSGPLPGMQAALRWARAGRSIVHVGGVARLQVAGEQGTGVDRRFLIAGAAGYAFGVETTAWSVAVAPVAVAKLWIVPDVVFGTRRGGSLVPAVGAGVRVSVGYHLTENLAAEAALSHSRAFRIDGTRGVTMDFSLGVAWVRDRANR